MSIRNAAICRTCNRSGPKCTMHKVIRDGFVIGYEHDNCDDFVDFSKEIARGSIYDSTDNLIVNQNGIDSQVSIDDI